MAATTAAYFKASTGTSNDSSTPTNTLLKLSTDITDSAPPAVVITPFFKPERIVLDNTLYVYDHCPFWASKMSSTISISWPMMMSPLPPFWWGRKLLPFL
jgi:hypothetical protein